MIAVLLSPVTLVRRFISRLTRRMFTCCLAIVLAAILGCGMLAGTLYWLVDAASAQAETPPASQLLLLIDNSTSMYEKSGGIGSDPALLRIQAAKLFIAYLGVDSTGAAHQLGVIFFGGEARLVAPLTPLTNGERRDTLIRLIETPERMTWTDPAAALTLAETTFPTSGGTRQAVVLLTDGKPEWSTEPTETEKAAYIARLQTVAGRFAARDIPIFIILLANDATRVAPEIEGRYVPLWQDIVAATPPGRFFRANHSEALLDIYHDIAVLLTGRQSNGIVLQTRVERPTSFPVAIEDGLAQVTLVIRKSRGELPVEIHSPTGRHITAQLPGVQYGGQPDQSREEVWAIERPEAGVWQLWLGGAGDVTVWKDFLPAPVTPRPSTTATPRPTHKPAPTATPTATIPPPTNTPLPTHTPTPTFTPAAPPALMVSHIPPSSSPATPWLRRLAWVCLPLTGLLLVSSLAGWRQYQQRRPLLSGALRRLPPAGLGDRLLDLDRLNSRELSLGSLAADQSYLYLRAGHDPSGLIGVELIVPDKFSVAAPEVNSQPVQRQCWLYDGDVITIGGARYRYENLRQRVNRRRAEAGL